MNKPEKNKYFKIAITVANTVVSFLIFITILLLIFYMGYRVYLIALDVIYFEVQKILHNIAFLIVLIKAYKLLLFYLERHHVSIKYIMEIAIIASTVEIIFANSTHDLSTNILFAFFSIANLVVYLYFYRKLCDADEGGEMEPEEAFK